MIIRELEKYYYVLSKKTKYHERNGTLKRYRIYLALTIFFTFCAITLFIFMLNVSDNIIIIIIFYVIGIAAEILILSGSFITKHEKYDKYKFGVVCDWMKSRRMSRKSEEKLLNLIDYEISNSKNATVRLQTIVILGAICIPVWQAFSHILVMESVNNFTLEILLLLLAIIVFLTLVSTAIYKIAIIIHEKLYQSRVIRLKEISYYIKEYELKRENNKLIFLQEN